MTWRTIFLVLFLLLIIRTICKGESGTASWYGSECAGKLMANGQPFDPAKLTCAAWRWPLGTRLRVSFGQKSVVVFLTDRGPARRLNRVIDLSEAAFKQLADPKLGLVEVNITKL